MNTADAARQIAALSDEEVLREFQRTWTDRAQVARAIRKIMFDALSGADSATVAIDQIAAACGISDWKSPMQIVQAVQALAKRVDALVAQIETTPVLTIADRSTLAHYQEMQDRTRKFDAVVAERDELAAKIARMQAESETRR